MPVFHVYLNGEKVSTAGVGETGVLNTIVSWVRREGRSEEELDLRVGGLITPSDEHVRWLNRELKVGDEVSIRIAEDAPIDEPLSRYRHDPSKELNSQKRYVREMAEKLGWKILTE